MSKSLVFLTHRAPERSMASAIKRAVEDAFPGVDVFLSSDPENIGAGDPWVDSIATKLEACEVQIILASPESLSRPWVHFEAGHVWGRKKQIPACHSGQEPGSLPIPLSLLQAGKVIDPEFLQSMFAAIAKVVDNRPPEVDYKTLAKELTAIEAGYLAASHQPEPTTETTVIPRSSGPEMRGLSDDRQRLETRLYAAVLKWNTLRSKGITGDPNLSIRAVEVANAFWANPQSLVLDHEVANAIAVMEASIADLEARSGASKPLRVQLLRALRERNYEQDQTNEILRFDVDAFAAASGAGRDAVSRRLRDLLNEGLAEPYVETLGESAIDGAVRITPAGIRELRRLGETDD